MYGLYNVSINIIYRSRTPTTVSEMVLTRTRGIKTVHSFKKPGNVWFQAF